LRSDIDPLEIPDLLPILNLVDVLPGLPRFRHRLVGTELIERMGRDATGKFADDGLYGTAAAEIAATLQRIVDEVRPFRRRARLDWFERSYLSIECAEMPLRDDSGRVIMILRAVSFSRPVSIDKPRLEFVPLP
jgi:hypothetical protein